MGFDKLVYRQNKIWTLMILYDYHGYILPGNKYLNKIWFFSLSSFGRINDILTTFHLIFPSAKKMMKLTSFIYCAFKKGKKKGLDCLWWDIINLWHFWIIAKTTIKTRGWLIYMQLQLWILIYDVCGVLWCLTRNYL